MKIKIYELKAIIRKLLLETGGGVSSKSRPTLRNPLSSDMANREQIGSLGKLDVVDHLTDHLIDDDASLEDIFGPVPPVQDSPYLTQDPFVRFSSPLPSSPIKR